MAIGVGPGLLSERMHRGRLDEYEASLATRRGRRDDETRQIGLKVCGGQMVLPVAGADCEVDITFTGTVSAGSPDWLP